MTAVAAQPSEKSSNKPAWVKIVAKYQRPVISISVWQIINSFGPYLLLTALAYLSLSGPYWLTLIFTVLAGLFLMRVFIIQHDCGHQSFFKTKKANNYLGRICGILTMTPYDFWKTTHAIHHATSGDLDFRGIGDVETKTVKEYLTGTRMQRWGYRIYRNPFMMFGIGPLYMFCINQRMPIAWRYSPNEAAKRSLILTDLALLTIWGVMIAIFGLGNVVKVQFPTYLIATTVGVWMFYVQHNYEDAYWRLHPEWTFEESAMLGSSYYKLPKLLQWFSGNIGLHHIHHLSPKIPNYLLQQAYDENEYLQEVHVLTLRSSLQIIVSRLALWDEDLQKMVSFAYVHKHYMKAGVPVTPSVIQSVGADASTD